LQQQRCNIRKLCEGLFATIIAVIYSVLFENGRTDPMQTTSSEVVYCNNCGVANPRNSAICCNCGHVHAITSNTPQQVEPVVVVEQWFWIVLRIACGVVLSIGYVLPRSGTTLDAAVVGRMFGSIAIPVAIAAVLGGGKWGRSSRWFLGAALALVVVNSLSSVFGRIHFR
jgi:hypothetical protein